MNERNLPKFLIVFLLFGSMHCLAQNALLEQYQDKLNKLDSTRYFSGELIYSRHLLGGRIGFIALAASQYYLGEKISTFIDTTKEFSCTGELMRIQVQNELGLVTVVYEYDRSGRLKRSCEYLPDTDTRGLPYRELQNGREFNRRKFRKGKEYFSGNWKAGKKEGQHTWYHPDGSVKRTLNYTKGKKD